MSLGFRDAITYVTFTVIHPIGMNPPLHSLSSPQCVCFGVFVFVFVVVFAFVCVVFLFVFICVLAVEKIKGCPKTPQYY